MWREALVTASHGELTKHEARDRVEAATPNSEDLDVRLIDLPRHRIAILLPVIAASVA